MNEVEAIAPCWVKPAPQAAWDNLEERIKSLVLKREWLEKHRDILFAIGLPCSFSGENFDFDHLKHEQILAVIQAFGGVWQKEPSCGTVSKVDYITVCDGVTIRCWEGEPPPSCRLVEVEVEVPAEPAKPARMIKVMKLTCPRGVI
jgi:hypothetical protein